MRSALLPLFIALAIHCLAADQSPRGDREQQSDPFHACRALVGMEVPAVSIGLPTNGAYVKSANLVRDGRSEYCKVLGRIRPIDPSAHDIRFEVNLPSKWNHKAVHFGGGTFDGWMGGPASGLKRGPMGIKTEPTPLARGFATFGGDSGHHKNYFPLLDFLNALNASFARNPEERRNYLHDALKKTHDTALAVIESRYGSRPSRMFFIGGSTGGRETFAVVQRWPENYDGVLAAYASWNQTQLALQFIRISQALYAKGGYLGRPQTKLLLRSVMNACDQLDGLRDGIISNVAACRFDPSTLLCAEGRHRNCLSPQQLKTVQTFATEQRTAQPLTNGVQSIPGINVLAGTDLTHYMGVLRHPQRRPRYFLNSVYYVFGDRMLRNFLATDANFDSLSFDTTSGGQFAAELLPQAEANDASSPDLERFAHHGGKFLIVHGTADATVPTNASVMYYEMVQGRMSQQEMDKFLRLYLVPGFGHERGVFKASFNALNVLDQWLDTGLAPENLVVADNNRRTAGRTRPMCIYPEWPRYIGSGDVNAASSFVCVDESLTQAQPQQQWPSPAQP